MGNEKKIMQTKPVAENVLDHILERQTLESKQLAKMIRSQCSKRRTCIG